MGVKLLRVKQVKELLNEKNEAIRYLKYLHSLESKYRKNLFSLELACVVEQIRFEFIENYKRG